MNLNELIKSRYCVRSFTDDNIDIKTIREILEIASNAPSGGWACSGGEGGSGGGGGKACYNCGEFGHISRDCPKPLG